MRASYRDAIRWIAENDEGGETDPEVIADMITALLVADLFGKEPAAVAAAVIRKRKDFSR
jgi:hypothetical protein